MRHTVIAVVLIVLAPTSALACPVCGLAGTQDNWAAYAAMTVLLSGLPLLMIGGVVFWLYRRAVASDGGEPSSEHVTGRPEPQVIRRD